MCESQEPVLYHTPNGIIKQIDIFKGKTALVGDYSAVSYFNTEMVLSSLGFKVDIVSTIDEIVEKIKQNENYDVIFSNNIYRGDTGETLVNRLKQLPDFDTPVILHSVSDDILYKSLFDGFLSKPIKQNETLALLTKLLH